MLTKFRQHHLQQLETAYRTGRLPLDRVVSDYFRRHRALGANDRRIIGNTLFDRVRWGVLFDFLGEEVDPWTVSAREDIPAHVRCGCPEAAFSVLMDALGPTRALELGLVSNEQAPTTVRVNTVRATREQLLEHWAHWGATPCELSDVGVRLPRRQALLALPEYRAGWFELQDEGSQLIADQVAVKPGDLVLDFCAGAGGKSLAIGPNMGGRGQLFLHDVRRSVLRTARRRLARAGIQQVQFLDPGDRRLEQLQGRMDWVLVDAPCSGTGTWRRNVDMKHRFSRRVLQELLRTQREILRGAVQYLAPGGRLVYATCSVLPEENQQQVVYATQKLGLTEWRRPLCSWPTSGGMDGVFAAVLAL